MNLNPVDWYNENGRFIDIFDKLKCVFLIVNENEVAFYDPTDLNSNAGQTTFKNEIDFVSVLKNNQFNIPKGRATRFTLLVEIKFKGDYQAAMSYVSYYLMGNDVPYIRVGTDYYKVIKEVNRYGAEITETKLWKKDEIKEDHGKGLFKMILNYDKFTLKPSNKNYSHAIGNNYNLYSKFPYEASKEIVTEEMIPTTMTLMKHIFGDQLVLGLKYMKILYLIYNT